jgi:hypothetical protein
MAIPGIQEIQALATKYSKPQLQKMAQMGLVDPTKAVMAGMMIDRIQQQNMQPPQQTVAEEVMGGPPPMPAGAPPSAPPPAPPAGGVAGLPSNLPPQMAGGGIVAFAEGGDTEEYADGGVVGYKDEGLVKDAGITGVIDPNWASAKSFKRNYSSDDKFAVLAEQLAQLTAAERQAQGVDKIRIQKDMEELRATMRSLKASPRARSLVDEIPLAAAGAAEARPAASKAVAPIQTGGDAVYSPEGVLLYGEPDTVPAQRKIEPGQPYEGNLLRDILEGRPNAPLPEIKRPTPAPAPAPATEASPKVAEKPAEKPAAKAEMGPSKPDIITSLRNIGIEEPETLTLDRALQEQDKAYEKMGVSKDLFLQIRQDYEGKRGKFKDRADKAAGHALMMFGAGLIGAREGELFSTASKSAQQSLMMYMGTMDKLAEQDDRLDQTLRELTVAEDQYKRTRADSALGRIAKHQEKIDAIRLENAKLELNAQKSAADFVLKDMEIKNPPQLTLIKNIALDSGKTPTEVFMMANGVAKTGNLTLNQALEAVQRNTQFMGKSPTEQLQEAQRMVGGGGGGSSLTIGQVVDGYKYKGGDPNSQSSWEKAK